MKKAFLSSSSSVSKRLRWPVKENGSSAAAVKVTNNSNRLSPSYLTTTQKYPFSFWRTHEATSQWLTEMENRFQIYLCLELNIFLRNNELWGHQGLVLFPTCRDNLILEEKVTNEQDILIRMMCFSHFNVSWTTKMFIFLSSLFLRLRKNSVTKGEEIWIIPAPSTQLPKNKIRCSSGLSQTVFFTVVGRAIPLSSRESTKKHFP